EVIHAVLGEGDWFGEVALIDGGPEPASGVAARPLLVLTASRSALAELMEVNGRLALAFAELLAGRVREEEQRVEETQLYDLSTRLARTLIALAARHARR